MRVRHKTWQTLDFSFTKEKNSSKKSIHILKTFTNLENRRIEMLCPS